MLRKSAKSMRDRLLEPELCLELSVVDSEVS